MIGLRSSTISDVFIIEPSMFNDHRGCYIESYNDDKFAGIIGKRVTFFQDAHSISHKNVVRGLHYQIIRPQGKLVRVIRGSIFDVAVDVRKNSPSFGKWIGETLSAENRKQLWIPAGCAHGFMALSDDTHVLYKMTDGWFPAHERTILWDDKDLGIRWPEPCPKEKPTLSDKDSCGIIFKDAECYI